MTCGTEQPVINHPDKNGAAESPTKRSTGRNLYRGKRSERKSSQETQFQLTGTAL